MTGVNETEFFFFDVETTGLAPDFGDRVVEFAFIRTLGKKEIERFETLINPMRPISWQASLVNGITDTMVSSSPQAGDVINRILKGLRGACLVGHNLRFDLNFLKAEFAHAKKEFILEEHTIDTVKLSRGILPQLGRYSLSHVASFLGINDAQKHRAMADVVMTKDIFFRLLEIAKEKNIESLAQIINLFGTQKTIRQRKKEKEEIINKAIKSNFDVEIIYFGTTNGATVRKVKPLDICGSGREKAMIGFCHLRNEERSFRLDRIIQVKAG